MTTSTPVERRRARARLALLSIAAALCPELASSAAGQPPDPRVPGRRTRVLCVALTILAGFLALPTAATASETVTYKYDAKGRLTDVKHVGGPEDAATAAYRYDAADNRQRQTVSNAKPAVAVNAPTVVVVPLNGLHVIALQPDI